MRLNLIAEPSNCAQLPSSVQCTPTYCTLEPGSNRVSVGIKNVSSRAITIPSRVVVGKLQQARVVPDGQSSKFKHKCMPLKNAIEGYHLTSMKK